MVIGTLTEREQATGVLRSEYTGTFKFESRPNFPLEPSGNLAGWTGLSHRTWQFWVFELSWWSTFTIWQEKDRRSRALEQSGPTGL